MEPNANAAIAMPCDGFTSTPFFQYGWKPAFAAAKTEIEQPADSFCAAWEDRVGCGATRLLFGSNST
jgi:hypothetical protein